MFGHETNPVEVAELWAQSFRSRAGSTSEDEDSVLLTILDEQVEEYDAGGVYYVEAKRALSIPVTFSATEPVDIGDTSDVRFEGSFTTFSIVSVGKITGAHAVRALCLAFEAGVTLPHLQVVPFDHLLHIPVLAVESIERTS